MIKQHFDPIKRTAYLINRNTNLMLAFLALALLAIGRPSDEEMNSLADYPCKRSHIVAKGEKLVDISTKYGIPLDELVVYNPSLVDPGIINQGQSICLDRSPDEQEEKVKVKVETVKNTTMSHSNATKAVAVKNNSHATATTTMNNTLVITDLKTLITDDLLPIFGDPMAGEVSAGVIRKVGNPVLKHKRLGDGL